MVLIREALEVGDIQVNLHVVSDGVEALSFLRKEGVYKDDLTPDIVLLDLNLPKKDGREVLVEIKNDEQLNHIPVIVLTTSESDEDIRMSYKNHANSYVTKPINFKDFVEIMQSIKSFWFHTVNLPTENGED